MKPVSDRDKRKIEQIQALINHPKTSEDERDAARRALKRIYDACEMHTRPVDEQYRVLYNPGAWKGSKYEQAARLSLTEIAKLIRADLRMARKVGQQAAATGPAALAVRDPIADAPAEIKYSVRTRYYSGGGAIDLAIKDIPAEWGWTVETDKWGNEYLLATDALASLISDVETIYHAYNYDNSDSMTDYFDRRYWGSVTTEPSIHIRRRQPW